MLWRGPISPRDCLRCTQGDVDRARELFQRGVWADPRSLSTAVILHVSALTVQACYLEKKSALFHKGVWADLRSLTTAVILHVNACYLEITECTVL